MVSYISQRSSTCVVCCGVGVQVATERDDRWLNFEYPDLSMLLLCSFIIIDFLSGNVLSLGGQVGPCLQAHEPEASAAPPSRLSAPETFGGRVALPPPPSSPQLPKHSCS